MPDMRKDLPLSSSTTNNTHTPTKVDRMGYWAMHLYLKNIFKPTFNIFYILYRDTILLVKKASLSIL